MKKFSFKTTTIKILGRGHLSNILQVYIFFMLCSMSLLTMTASKCQKENIVYFTVKFNSNGGSAVDSVQVASGSKVAKPADPILTNYTLDGWYSDVGLTQAFDFNTPITQNITLYAKWTLKSGATGTLSAIVGFGRIPNDLSSYDKLSQDVLMPYNGSTQIKAIYITANGAGTKDGTSWADAYPGDKLKTAIDNISDASDTKVYLVLMGGGLYVPEANLSMKNNVAIVGGFAVAGGWMRNPTTDTTTINGNKIISGFRGVFDNNGLNNTALLYGVKIAKSYTGYAGMDNTNSSPMVTNVIFENNGYFGMANVNSSSPIVTNVIFTNNRGGMINNNSSPIITNVIFSDNSSNLGGGIRNSSSSPIITNVVFLGNRKIDQFVPSGGGMSNGDNTSPVVVNAIFWANNAIRDPQYNLGGGTVNYSVVQDSSRATLSPTDPVLSEVSYTAGYFMPTITYSGTSPDNLGVYVKRTRKPDNSGKYTFYYSIDGTTWYTSPTDITKTGASAATLPASSDLIDLTATDIQGRPRTGRPNAGVWAK